MSVIFCAIISSPTVYGTYLHQIKIGISKCKKSHRKKFGLDVDFPHNFVIVIDPAAIVFYWHSSIERTNQESRFNNGKNSFFHQAYTHGMRSIISSSCECFTCSSTNGLFSDPTTWHVVRTSSWYDQFGGCWSVFEHQGRDIWCNH